MNLSTSKINAIYLKVDPVKNYFRKALRDWCTSIPLIRNIELIYLALLGKMIYPKTKLASIFTLVRLDMSLPSIIDLNNVKPIYIPKCIGLQS